MADITWSAYALAMFTPEQRAAAVQAAYEPPEVLQPLPAPPVAAAASTASGALVQVGSRLLDANKPNELQAIYAAGWRYEQGKWIAPGSLGVAATTDQAVAGGGVRPSSLSAITSASSIQGASVLGTTVPVAPAVLLPSFVGGAFGVVRMGGGLRPESGGTPKRVVMGPGRGTFPQVRMGPLNWGR